MHFRSFGLLLFVAAAACVPRSEAPAPPPQPRPQAPPPARPAPPPPAPIADWRDRQLSPGAWVYSAGGGSSQALYGPAASEASFVVRCDRARRVVTLAREGRSTGAVLTVRTTETARSFPATAQAAPLAGLSTELPANDRFLDAMAFSRGRLLVEAAGLQPLVLPSWPEPARVVEDCRP